ncbi:potassium channel [Aureococcus anophagefferens]|nr:potassium channel [Aureococcus anophagefferens]
MHRRHYLILLVTSISADWFQEQKKKNTTGGFFSKARGTKGYWFRFLWKAIDCPFRQVDDPAWAFTFPKGGTRTCANIRESFPEQRIRLCRQTGADGVPAKEACANACLKCCDGHFLATDDPTPNKQCAMIAPEVAAATAAAARASHFCDDPPPRAYDDDGRDTFPGPRAVQAACFGRFQEAHRAAAPDDDTTSAAMHAACCVHNLHGGLKTKEDLAKPDAAEEAAHGVRDRKLMYPRSQIEAARYYASTSTRDVDVNFIGRLDRQPGVNLVNHALRDDFDPRDFATRIATRMRLWLLPFVRKLGPYDASVDADGSIAGFRPMNEKFSNRVNVANVTRHTCRKATCDPTYYEKLARSRFTLAPAGDMPWSLRFFEAIMAGTSRGGGGSRGAVPYCEAWAAHNLAIFLEHQSYIEDPATIEPGVGRCRAEAFA